MVSYEHTGERKPTQEAADCAYLRTMLSLVDVDDIAEKIAPGQGKTSGLGRKSLARGPMVRALLAGRIEGYETQSRLISQLAKNPALRRACGFGDALPSRRTFGRVFKKLKEPETTAMLESKLDSVVNLLRALLPDLGVDVSVDATTVQSFTRRKPLSKGHERGQCPSAGKYVGCKRPDKCLVFTDPEASLGFKHCSKSPDGKRLVQGYKVITLSCARYDVALATITVTGRSPETLVLKDLFYKAKAKFSWFAPETLIADAAYDAGYNYAFLLDEGVEPVINITDTPGGELRDGIYTKVGIPTCMGKVEMEYVRTDEETGFRLYRCREGGCERLNRIKGWSTCRDAHWEDPSENPRLFGRKLRRGSPEFEEKYGLRGGIERIFGWWKDACNLERHRYRGLENVSLHALLTALGYEIKRLSMELFGKIRNPAG